MVGLRSNPAEFQRLRLMCDSILLSDGDKGGPLLVEMDRVHSRQARKAYTTQGASTGAAWKPLSERYRQYKRKARPGRKILVFNGETRERFTMPTNPNHIREYVKPFTYRFGVASEKAWRAETGTGEGRQVLPRRSVLDKTAADYSQFVEALRTFYLKRIKQVLRHL